MTRPKNTTTKQFNGALYRKIAKASKAFIKDLPQSFTALSVPVGKTMKVFIFCNKELSGGQICDFCIRKDVWNGDPEKLKHTCKHINRIVFHEKTIIPDGFKGLTKAINKFTATANLSFKQVTSNEFRDVIILAIQIGQVNQGTNPGDLFQQQSRKTFTLQWNKESNEVFHEQLLEYSKQAGSALALDAGKHKSTPYLLIIVTNVLVAAPPLLVRSVRFFGGKTIDYKNAMNEVIIDLNKEGIKISGIITDNLRSQTSAVDHNIKGSIQNSPDAPPYIRSIIWFACSCHTLALGINDTLKTCEEFSSAYDDLSEAVSFLRMKNVINILELK